MKQKDILKEKEYLTANELMLIIPNLTYLNAIKYINLARDKMQAKGYYVPITKPRVALTSVIREIFGF